MKRILPLLILPLLAACTASTQESPTLYLSPKGDAVAFLPHPNDESNHVVLLLNFTTNKLTKIHIPHGGRDILLAWMNGNILLTTPNHLDTLDPQTGAIIASKPLTPGPYNEFPPTFSDYHGQHAVFAPQFANDHFSTRILSLPDLAPLDSLDFLAQPLGLGYMLRDQSALAHSTYEMNLTYAPAAPAIATTRPATATQPAIPEILEVLDQNGKLVAHFSDTALAEIGPRISPFHASLSPDGRSLMLAQLPNPSFFGAYAWDESSVRPHYAGPIAVFQIPTGKLLYKVADPGHIVSPAFLTNDALYAVSEYLDPASNKPGAPYNLPHQYWLTRHTAAGSEKILLLPILPQRDAILPPLFTTAFCHYESYNTAAPVLEFLLIHTANPDGSHPQLLKIPLAAKLTPADIQTFDLSPKQHP